MVAERAYEKETHWLMFMFELKPRLQTLPAAHEEGLFQFVPLAEVLLRPVPATDRDILWPLFQKNRGGFFAASIVCHPDGALTWTMEETLPS